MLDSVNAVCMDYFLCEYSPISKKQRTLEIVRTVGGRYFNSEVMDQFIEVRLAQFQEALVDEFNARSALASPLRFEVADDVGEGSIVKGFSGCDGRAIEFQDQLNAIDFADFEKLSALVLQKIGCTQVWSTPESHDQGVDAFGLKQVVPEMSRSVAHRLTFIAQAKHYAKTALTTANLRELVGSKELVLHKIFSTVDTRYKELRLLPYAPTAIVFVTSHEISATFRRLAERAGVFVLAAFDLYDLFAAGRPIADMQQVVLEMVEESKAIAVLR